jgi:kojibiose phosphorylase
MEAVIFDLDGVLTSTDRLHFESWKVVLEGFGIEVADSNKDRLLGLTRRRSLDILLGERSVTNEILEEMLKRKNERYLDLIETLSPHDLAPGISILLQELNLARFRIGVASASQNVLPVLRNLGIDGFVQAISDGIKVRRPKPEPDAFLFTARALKVDPQFCLTIEDSAAGIQAARSAGMVVIGLGPSERVRGAHLVLDNLHNIHLKDLQEIFLRCLNHEPIPITISQLPQAA